MERGYIMKIKDVKIGNVVRVDKSIVDKEFDLIGRIKAIYPNHILVIDNMGFWYSILPSDFSKVTLVVDAGFREYDEKDYVNDIKEALSKNRESIERGKL